GTEQDVDLAALEGVENLLVTAGTLGRIGIHAAHDLVGKLRLDLCLQLLCAQALVANLIQPALRTAHGRLALDPAVVAQSEVADLVIRDGEDAELALLDPPAGGAVQIGREAAAIEQQHYLSAAVQRLPHGPLETRADGVLPAARMPVVPQIDERDLRQRQIE